MDESGNKDRGEGAAMNVEPSGKKPRARLQPAETTPPGVRKASITPGKIDRLMETVDNLGEVRQRKIGPIKKRLAEGAYRVDAQKIAERVVKEAANDAVHRGKCGLRRWPQDAD